MVLGLFSVASAFSPPLHRGYFLGPPSLLSSSSTWFQLNWSHEIRHYLNEFPRAVPMNYHTLEAQNDRNLLSHGSGLQNSEMKVSAGPRSPPLVAPGVLGCGSITSIPANIPPGLPYVSLSNLPLFSNKDWPLDLESTLNPG